MNRTLNMLKGAAERNLHMAEIAMIGCRPRLQ